MARLRTIAFLSILLVLLPAIVAAKGGNRGRGKPKHNRVVGIHNVTYDGKSLFVNGRRELLFSGSIHYTRSTPDVYNLVFLYYISSLIIVIIKVNNGLWFCVQMWPAILEKARHGGLNVIQTYVFWNVHEPEPGKVYINKTKPRISSLDSICLCDENVVINLL